jgi:hypothetical protein
MLYLPDELFKHKNKKFKIIIGEPIPYQTFTNEKTDFEHANEIKKKVYQLKNNLY